MELALDAILGQRSAHSLATGPVMADPFISPLLLTMTPALSSKYINTPSRLLNGFRCLMITAGMTCQRKNHYYHAHKTISCYSLMGCTFFLSSGFPFLTVAITMSPDPAAGNLFKRPLIPWTAITYRFLAPIIVQMC